MSDVNGWIEIELNDVFTSSISNKEYNDKYTISIRDDVDIFIEEFVSRLLFVDKLSLFVDTLLLLKTVGRSITEK
jgi:hypothetical protein